MGEERWSVYDPGHDGPEYRRRADYGFSRLDGRPPEPPRPARHASEHRSFWSQTRDEVQAWLGDPAAEDRRRHDARLAGHEREIVDWHDEDDIVWAGDGRSEPVSHRGRGPRGYRRPDQRIGEDVADRLTDDPYLDATDIRVDVVDGEVRLTGRVDSEDARRRTERLTERVSGVAKVWNQLEIRR